MTEAREFLKKFLETHKWAWLALSECFRVHIRKQFFSSQIPPICMMKNLLRICLWWYE
jgi:hypothetical protein